MLNNLRSLAILCSTGSILVVLGIILKLPSVILIAILLCGLLILSVSVYGLTKLLLSDGKSVQKSKKDCL